MSETALKSAIKLIEALTYTFQDAYGNEFIYHPDGSKILWDEVKDFWKTEVSDDLE